MEEILKYEINKDTLAILPIDYNKTRVVELDNEYIVLESAFKVMDYSCRYYGSSYDGRVKGTKSIIEYEYKLPVLVEESNNIIFFPTTAPSSSDCIWISLNNIKKINKLMKNSSINFINDLEINLDISYNSLSSQIFRSSLLVSKLENRKKRI